MRLLRQQLFQPFVLQMSTGQAFEVGHLEMAALHKSNLLVSRPDSDEYEVCSLLHIANIKANGSIVAGN